jgi:hypothetical protein
MTDGGSDHYDGLPRMASAASPAPEVPGAPPDASPADLAAVLTHDLGAPYDDSLVDVDEPEDT